MTKEQKLIFLVTIFPMVRDFLEDVKDEYPLIFRQNLKKTSNDLIDEIDKIGYKITDLYESMDIDEVRQQYQDVYMVHLGIAKELF
jgi:Txe/YoeB family toxin of Txe-Axe toxin-antitoxin module